jgi:hypothetical protein
MKGGKGAANRATFFASLHYWGEFGGFFGGEVPRPTGLDKTLTV